MRYRMLAATILSCIALTGMVAMAEEQDPYVWLEDIHGAKPLEWVAAQNAVSLKALKSDPRYQSDHDAILSVLDATDRIPMGALIKGYVFNFWQDAANPKGVWRRTSVADYANPAPHWEVLLDVDKLAADEHENWVWKGARLRFAEGPVSSPCRAAAATPMSSASSILPANRSAPAASRCPRRSRASTGWATMRCCSPPISVPAR